MVSFRMCQFFFFPLCSCFLGTVPQRWFILKTSERTDEKVFQTGRELAGITVHCMSCFLSVLCAIGRCLLLAQFGFFYQVNFQQLYAILGCIK